MKTLILLRHAKSDWNVEFEQDHDRPLNRRGRRAAMTVGKVLATLDEVPDKIVTSSAIRAHTTVETAAEAGGWDSPVEVTSDLYGASSSAVLQVIRRCDDELGRILLAGHEPTWSSLASELIGGGRIRVVTAAMVRIDFEVARWRDIAPRLGELIWSMPPRVLEKLGV